MSATASIEAFHLQFSRLLLTGPDKDCFAIKGGCNLRFFFESVRYSEDIDIDVSERIPVHALKDRVVRVLDGNPLGLALRNRRIRIAGFSAPKQTETTQRWKIQLQVDGSSQVLPTKVEFSRRPPSDSAVLEPVIQSVLAEHQSMQFLAPHYPLDAALRQKVEALADRREVQARDVFDLGGVLIPRAGGDTSALEPVHLALGKALDRAMTLSYGDYKAQVISYLHPDHAASLGTREAWDAMQTSVVDFLDRARSSAPPRSP